MVRSRAGMGVAMVCIMCTQEGPDPLKHKRVFAGSDYLTASASRRYFNLGGILVQEKWTKLLKP